MKEGVAAKVAVTLALELPILNEQPPFPEQLPDHPLKTLPDAGMAVKLTAAPLARPIAEHTPAPLVQLMLVDPAVPLTVPPDEVTVSV